MMLLERDEIHGYDPEDGKSYFYSIELEHTITDEDYPYVIKFNRRGYGQPTESLRLMVDKHDIGEIYKDPECYWNYYKHLYHFDTPLRIYCRFDNEGILHYRIDTHHIPSEGSLFNKVLRDIHASDARKYGYPSPGVDNDIYGYRPIFELNVWSPRDKSLESDLTEHITEIIRKYIEEEE